MGFSRKCLSSFSLQSWNGPGYGGSAHGTIRLVSGAPPNDSASGPRGDPGWMTQNARPSRPVSRWSSTLRTFALDSHTLEHAPRHACEWYAVLLCLLRHVSIVWLLGHFQVLTLLHRIITQITSHLLLFIDFLVDKFPKVELIVQKLCTFLWLVIHT